MFEQTLAIIRNTFFESIRQPIMLVILVVATLLIIASNLLSGFTMEDDQKMFVDLGLGTIFLAEALLAAFIATNVIGREIENRTALTVISKPVGRPLFVIGKYLGVTAAIVLATLYLAFVFMLVDVHGVLQTVRDPIHRPVVIFGLGAAFIGLAAAVWVNYFYNKVFASSAIIFLTPLAGLAYLFSLFFGPDFTNQPLELQFRPELWIAVLLLVMAVLVLSAVAVAISTRLGQVATLALTIAVFLGGMMSDWMFGRPIAELKTTWEQAAMDVDEAQIVQVTHQIQRFDKRTRQFETDERVEDVVQTDKPLISYATTPQKVEYAAYWTGYAILPNFQIFWLADAITQSHLIPREYVLRAIGYGAMYIGVALSLAVILFQRREVG